MSAAHSSQLSSAPLRSSLGAAELLARPVWANLPDSLPLTPFERFILRNDTPQTPMVFRVILRWQGRANQEALSTAYSIATRQQPLLNSCLTQNPEGLCWTESRNATPLHWLPESVTEAELRDWPITPIAILQESGLRSYACQRADQLHVICDFHHACSDGQGARQFFIEWMGIYHQLLEQDLLSLHGLDHSRLESRSSFHKPAESVTGSEGLRNLYLTIKGRNARLPRRSPDETAPLAHFREYSFSEDKTAALRQALRSQRLTMNDLGLAAAFETFHELFPQHVRRRFISIANPTDLRRPSDLRTPACNRIGFAFIRRQKKEWRNSAELLQSVQSQLQYVKRKFVGVEFLNGLAAADGVRGMVDAIQKLGWFTPTMQFTCLGDVTRAVRYPLPFQDGELNIEGLRLHHVSGFPPLGLNVPLSLAACETSNRLSLAVRASSLYLTAEETEQFTAAFVENFQRMLPRTTCDQTGTEQPSVER